MELKVAACSHTHDHPIFFQHLSEPLQENAEHKIDMMVSDSLLTFVNGHIYWTVSFILYSVKKVLEAGCGSGIR